jgi:hypothetical protein
MLLSDYKILLEDFASLERMIRGLPQPYFELLTPREITERKEALVTEISLDAAFKLLTKLEADLKRDLATRVARRGRDTISRRYLVLLAKMRISVGQVRRDPIRAVRDLSPELLLDALRDHFRDQADRFHSRCSVAKGYFHFRNWFAHGRYSRIVPPIPRPDEVAAIGEELSAKLAK